MAIRPVFGWQLVIWEVGKIAWNSQILWRSLVGILLAKLKEKRYFKGYSFPFSPTSFSFCCAFYLLHFSFMLSPFFLSLTCSLFLFCFLFVSVSSLCRLNATHN
jgi:hypothetical protein